MVHIPTEIARLPEQIRTHILAGIQSWSDHDVTTEDLLRVYLNQVSLLFVTEQVRSALAMDPFQHLRENIHAKDLEQLQSSVTVSAHHAVHTMEGYVRIEATIRLSPVSHRSSRRGRTIKEGEIGGVELCFQYTRPTILPLRVSYTIDLSFIDDMSQPSQPLRVLWIYIDAAGSVPSLCPAVLSKDDDGWSDIDEGEGLDVGVGNCTDTDNGADDATHDLPDHLMEEVKDTEEHHSPLRKPLANMEDHNGKPDQYEAGMDPEAISQFTHALKLGSSMQDITVFFLLMTFPFYEHEWDIVEFLLEAVFDSDEKSQEDDSRSAK